MVEGKKERKTILALIKDSVMKAPKSMYELAKELGSNWDTVRNNVNLLQDLGVVDVNDSKVVYMQHTHCAVNEDTIAGLPISHDTKQKVYALAKRFYVEWKKRTDKDPNRTVFQKAMVEIADSFPELEIPRGWYFYGKVIFVKMMSEKISKFNQKYDFKDTVSDIKKLEAKIREVVDRYVKMTTQQIVHEQYQRHENKLYLTKKKIENDLLYEDYKKNRESISKDLYELVFLFDLKKNDELSVEVQTMLKDVISLMILKLNDKEFIDKKECKIILYEVFTGLWRLVSTYNLYATQEGQLGYDEAVIKSFFEDKICLLKMEFLDQLQNSGFMPA